MCKSSGISVTLSYKSNYLEHFTSTRVYVYLKNSSETHEKNKYYWKDETHEKNKYCWK